MPCWQKEIPISSKCRVLKVPKVFIFQNIHLEMQTFAKTYDASEQAQQASPSPLRLKHCQIFQEYFS